MVSIMMAHPLVPLLDTDLRRPNAKATATEGHLLDLAYVCPLIEASVLVRQQQPKTTAISTLLRVSHIRGSA